MTPELSLLFLIGLVSTLNGCVLAWAVWMGAPRRVTTLFSLGCFALAASTATPLLVSSNASPWWASGFNLLPMLSYALWLAGTLVLTERQSWLRPMWLLLGLLTLPVLWYTFVDPQRIPRVTLVAASLAALRLATAVALLRAGPRLDSRVATVFAMVMLVESVTMATRGALASTGAVSPIGSSTDPASTLTWITMLSSALLATPLLMLLGLGRMIGDLQRGAARMEATLEALPDTVIELDAARRVRRVRSKGGEALPFEANAVPGRGALELWPGHSRSEIGSMIDRAVSGEGAGEVQFAWERDGRQFWTELRAASHAASIHGGCVLVARDVTGRHRAEQALRQRNDLLQNLFSLSPIGLLLSELESGTVREANAAFLAQRRMTPGSALPDNYRSLLAPASHPTLDRMRAALRGADRAGPLDVSFLRADGSAYAARLYAVAAADSDGVRLVWSMVEDVHEQLRVQRAKAELVAVVGHELRTPLTAMSGAMKLLPELVGGGLDARGRQLVQVALGNAQRLGQLIDDLIDLDRLVSGTLPMSSLRQPLLPLLQSCADTHAGMFATAGVRLELRVATADREVEVDVDGQRFCQALGHLLTNAAKFSPQGGVVELSMRAGSGEVEVAVIDQGSGVPPAFVPYLFQRFALADASDSRRRSGSGLGLALASELVERMRGRIDYQPAAAGGACFRIWLPWERAAITKACIESPPCVRMRVDAERGDLEPEPAARDRRSE